MNVGDLVIILIVAIPLLGAQLVLIIKALKGQQVDPETAKQIGQAQEMAQQALNVTAQHSRAIQTLALATPTAAAVTAAAVASQAQQPVSQPAPQQPSSGPPFSLPPGVKP